MKKILWLFVCLMTMCVTANAQETEHLKFMGIPIEGNANAFIQKLASKGFVKTNTTDYGILLKGTFAGVKDAELCVLQTPKTKQVWKVAVYLPKENTWSSIKHQYEKFKTSFSEKYGEPDSHYEFFKSPYYEGDGYEESAVKLGKCYYSSFWGCGLMVDISKFMQVRLAYEDPTNADLDEKERNEVVENDI